MSSNSPEPRRCPNCGARVAQQADTCMLCGQRLRRSTYLTPTLALLAVAVVGGILIAGLRDRSSGGAAPTFTPPVATVFALADTNTPTAPGTTPAGANAPAATDTAVPPTLTPTAVPTETETSTPVPSDTPAPTPAPRVHIVTSGDVLSTIAQQYDVSMGDILAVNPGLTERTMLRVGQEIAIPGGAATAEAEVAAPPVHVIESGDNLAYLADTYDTTVSAILAVNPGLTVGTMLRVGQEIVLPSDGAAAAPAAESQPQSFVHTLQSGETIGYLANMYDTTTDAILSANPGITRWSILRVGQEIVIPVPPPSGGPEPAAEPTATPTPEPTLTPANPAAMAAATAMPTASLMSMGGPAQPHAVEPLSPGGGTQVKTGELVLMWTGAGDLSSDLYYVVHVWKVGEPSDTITGWTRANSWRPADDLIARWGAGAHLYWDVGIGREIAVAGSGQPRFEPAGLRTEPQDFYLVSR